ncbi:hypothetical protein [Saccharopolyspora gloriosae]|uniref:hypothetical protein n=1 Tax=Saccharopolyspora gloriosae TaxID=455344 RepID=UPI001FB5DAEC|nr:hypothetical protein [Saccharopolyspora gloriosae]
MDDKIARLVDGAPQREWLCRCSDDDEEMAVCTVGVAAGDVEVIGPEYRGYFRLRYSEIAVFRRALDEAITVAEQDRARRAARQAESEPQSSNR